MTPSRISEILPNILRSLKILPFAWRKNRSPPWFTAVKKPRSFFVNRQLQNFLPQHRDNFQKIADDFSQPVGLPFERTLSAEKIHNVVEKHGSLFAVEAIYARPIAARCEKCCFTAVTPSSLMALHLQCLSTTTSAPAGASASANCYH